MPDVRMRMADVTAPYLREGEEVQVVFQAKHADKNGACFVVATNQRYLIFRQKPSIARPTYELLHEAPRTTQIGPASGIVYTTSALGVPLVIMRRYYKDIAAADAAIGS